MKKTLLTAAAFCLGMSGFAQLPYLQNFEGTNPPAGWAFTKTDAAGWKFGNSTAASSTYFAPPAHTTFAYMNDDALGSTAPMANDTMKTATITGIVANAWLTFDYYFFGNQDPTSGLYEKFTVSVSTNGGASWTQLASVPGISTNAWATIQYDLSAYAGQSIKLAFVYDGGVAYMYGAAVDNIAISVVPTNDIQFTALNPIVGSPGAYTIAGNNITMNGVITNLGSNPINTFSVQYTDGTGTWGATINPAVAVTTYNTYSFSITPSYSVAMGPHNIKSWVNLTGATPQSYDTLTTVLTGASFLPVHKMVVEEGTGTWCGWCPRGTCYMDSMKVMHPDSVVLVAVHNSTSDPMQVPVYDNGMTSLPGFTGFPTITADRKTLYDPSQIFQAYSDHQPDFGFANIALAATLSGSNLSVVASATTAVAMNGAYNFAVVLTEDSLYGTSTAWDQHNYYQGGASGQMRDGTSGWDFDVLPNPVPAASMHYDHVARSITGTYKGTNNSLPASMTAGGTYTYTFTSIPMNAAWKTRNMKVILMLIDAGADHILNATAINFSQVALGIAKVKSNINGVNVYPNPSNSNFNVNVDLEKAQKTTVILTNIMGQTVYSKDFDFNSGQNLLNISADQLASGMYTLSVVSETGTNQTKITVVK
ncbi:MAG: Omp28-related outer membrane protein [Bacteroidetes bacterium]|nr:Omp28-related outer membrane protein [Bacteroidota bacterium]